MQPHLEPGPVVIPHLDDIAGSSGANRAFLELAAAGTVSSGSVIVPSGWFAELATWHGLAGYDLGVHLTLTSESAAYRWRPISTDDPGSGLVDAAGYMWPTAGAVRAHADPTAVSIELRAQLDAALEAGIDVTHLDHHMGVALAPEFAAITVAIASDYGLPVLFPADVAGYLNVLELGEVDVGELTCIRGRAAALGVAFGDRFVMPLVHQARSDHDAVLRSFLIDPQPGVTYLSLHAATPGDIEWIHPNDAAWRIGEYEVLRSTEFATWMDANTVSQGLRGRRDEVTG